MRSLPESKVYELHVNVPLAVCLESTNNDSTLPVSLFVMSRNRPYFQPITLALPLDVRSGQKVGDCITPQLMPFTPFVHFPPCLAKSLRTKGESL